jgi:hypothetical protein
MKRFTFITGLLLVSSAVAVPLFYWRRHRDDREQNRRYDISDFLAEESL